jgi:ABC-2 type transport system permease protein
VSGGTTYAVRLGLRRGWTEFRQSLRSPQDQAFYLFMGVATLAYLWFNRTDEGGGDVAALPDGGTPRASSPHWSPSTS